MEERKTKANLKKDCFGGNRKMLQNMSAVKMMADTRDRWRCFTSVLFVMGQKDISLLLLLLLSSKCHGLAHEYYVIYLCHSVLAE